MNKPITIFWVCIWWGLMVAGCAGNPKKEIQKKLMRLSDRALISQYEMVDMRLIDIDRTREQSMRQQQDIDKRHYPADYQNHLGHLHIGDNWNRLRKEKSLIEIEMRKRSISPP
jgi:hypothetical protein